MSIPDPDLDDLNESIRKLEVAAGLRGARTWSGPRVADTPARKKARKRAKDSRKRNR